MEDDTPNIIRVKLYKRQEDGLGFLIKPRAQKPNVVISALVAGGLAEQCGLIQIGDVIIRVNEIDISDKSYDDAVELLKALPVDAPVAIVLRGQEGFTTHLETTFQENGIPRTIRVSRKLPVGDGIVSKLRRTFSRASSTSPQRSGVRGSTSPYRNRKKASANAGDHKAEGEGQYINNQCCICDIDRNFPLASCNGSAKRMSLKDSGSQTKVPPHSSTTINSLNQNSHTVGNNDSISPKIVVTRASSTSDVDDSTETLRGTTQQQSSGESSAVVDSGNNNRMTAVSIDQMDKNTKIIQNNDIIQVSVKEVSNSDPPNKSTMNGGTNHYSSPKKETIGIGSSASLLTNGDISDESKRRRDSFTNSLSPKSQRKLSDRRGSATAPKKFMKVKNVADEKVYTDTLHTKIIEVSREIYNII